MGRYGQIPGSALHRSWKKHEKVVSKGEIGFDEEKARYDQLKETKKLQREYKEMQEQIIREKVDAMKAKRERKQKNQDNQQRVTISDKKVKRMSKKQVRAMGIHKE